MENEIKVGFETASLDDSEPPGSLVAKSNLNIIKEKQKLSLTEPVNLGSFFISRKQKFEIVSDIEECRKLWQELAKPKTLFDTWEFRYAFYLGYGFKPYFLVLRSLTKNLAFLPLWYDEDEKKYVWFGSSWQEEVRFFAKNPRHLSDLIAAAPSPLFLNALSLEAARSLDQSLDLIPDDAKYILKLKDFESQEDYLASLKKNDRRNLKKDRRKIQDQNPQIIINNFADFDQLVALSKKRLAQKGDKADWEDPRRIETFRQVIKLSGHSYQARMISIKIDDRIAGVDLICLFKNTYFAIKCGYNVVEFSGIGNYMNLLEIDDAIKLKMEKIDFLQNNYTWKSKLFESIPLFKYEK